MSSPGPRAWSRCFPCSLGRSLPTPASVSFAGSQFSLYGILGKWLFPRTLQHDFTLKSYSNVSHLYTAARTSPFSLGPGSTACAVRSRRPGSGLWRPVAGGLARIAWAQPFRPRSRMILPTFETATGHLAWQPSSPPPPPALLHFPARPVYAQIGGSSCGCGNRGSALGGGGSPEEGSAGTRVRWQCP